MYKIFYCTQDKHENMVPLYNLRTYSQRTKHKHDVLPFHYIDSDAATCKKWICFWIGFTYYDEFSRIHNSFDLNHEVFETMLLLEKHDPNHYNYAYNVLDLLNDKLCYVKKREFGSV